MAKFLEILPSNEKIFDEVIRATDLERNVNIKILANNTQKEIYKIIKANDLVKHMTSEDIIIVINEKIFDQLEEQQKLIVADDAIAGIHCNLETGKVVVNKPEMNIHPGVVRKYTFPIYERVHETIKSLFEKEKNKKEAGVEMVDELNIENAPKADNDEEEAF